jgi:hypothetical protein
MEEDMKANTRTALERIKKSVEACNGKAVSRERLEELMTACVRYPGVLTPEQMDALLMGVCWWVRQQ